MCVCVCVCVQLDEGAQRGVPEGCQWVGRVTASQPYMLEHRCELTLPSLYTSSWSGGPGEESQGLALH